MQYSARILKERYAGILVRFREMVEPEHWRPPMNEEFKTIVVDQLAVLTLSRAMNGALRRFLPPSTESVICRSGMPSRGTPGIKPRTETARVAGPDSTGAKSACQPRS